MNVAGNKRFTYYASFVIDYLKILSTTGNHDILDHSVFG